MKSRTRLIVAAAAGLIALVVALGVAVVVLATRQSAPVATAAESSAPSPTAANTLTATARYSPPPPKDISVPFGETLSVTDSLGGEIHYTVTADKSYAKTKYGTKPKNGVLYGVKVLVEVVAGTTYVCACDFALIAADGTAYEGQSFAIAGGLEALDVNRGQKASGVVVFDIPTDAHKGGRIELREGGRSLGNQGFWLVP